MTESIGSVALVDGTDNIENISTKDRSTPRQADISIPPNLLGAHTLPKKRLPNVPLSQ
jgi:hypothetical protein